MNFLWLLVVAGGAAGLGGAIGFGMFRQNPKRTAFAMSGAALVALLALGISFLVSGVPDTAPTNPPDLQGSQYDGPARPSDQNALPGLKEPGK